jgi:hypothetical protein
VLPGKRAAEMEKKNICEGPSHRRGYFEGPAAKSIVHFIFTTCPHRLTIRELTPAHAKSNWVEWDSWCVLSASFARSDYEV